VGAGEGLGPFRRRPRDRFGEWYTSDPARRRSRAEEDLLQAQDSTPFAAASSMKRSCFSRQTLDLGQLSLGLFAGGLHQPAANDSRHARLLAIQGRPGSVRSVVLRGRHLSTAPRNDDATAPTLDEDSVMYRKHAIASIRVQPTDWVSNGVASFRIAPRSTAQLFDMFTLMRRVR